jgi:predicted metal-dependent phosphotriesterase family hydrolase
MQNRNVRTLRGDVPPELCGITHFHEHLLVREVNGVTLPKRLLIDDYEKSAQELERFKASGGGTIVDAQPFGSGRDIDGL